MLVYRIPWAIVSAVHMCVCGRLDASQYDHLGMLTVKVCAMNLYGFDWKLLGCSEF